MCCHPVYICSGPCLCLGQDVAAALSMSSLRKHWSYLLLWIWLQWTKYRKFLLFKHEKYVLLHLALWRMASPKEEMKLHKDELTPYGLLMTCLMHTPVWELDLRTSKYSRVLNAKRRSLNQFKPLSRSGGCRGMPNIYNVAIPLKISSF